MAVEIKVNSVKAYKTDKYPYAAKNKVTERIVWFVEKNRGFELAGCTGNDGIKEVPIPLLHIGVYLEDEYILLPSITIISKS